MDINKLIERLNNELNRLNSLAGKDIIDPSTFFTNDEHFNDDIDLDAPQDEYLGKDNKAKEISISNTYGNFPEITPNDEEKSILISEDKSIFNVQTVIKKSIKLSIKTFLISLSLSFLNLFI